jgi:hypothetical protein
MLMARGDPARFTHRTVNLSPSAYEQQLAATLFGILSSGIHDLGGIVDALNVAAVLPPDGQAWTDASFSAEMERLGSYPNSIGAPLGTHPVGVVPQGTSNPERLTGGGQS